MVGHQRIKRYEVPLSILICLLGVISCQLQKGFYAPPEEGERREVNVIAGVAGVEAGDQIAWVEGKTTLATGSRITTKYGARLLFSDSSLVYLTPGSELVIIDYHPELKLSPLKGCLEVETESSSPILEISTSTTASFVLEILNLTISPAGEKTSYRLWLDKPGVRVRVEVGQVRIRADGQEVIIPAGEELCFIPGEALPSIQQTARSTPSAPAAPATPPSPTLTPTTTLLTATTFPPEHPSYPSPVLVGPLHRSHFRAEEDILLIWAPVGSLAEDAWYEVQLWKPDETEHTIAAWSKENVWKVGKKYSPGLYNWRIVVVLGRDEQRQMELSPPSQTWTFSWGVARPPIPSQPTSTEPVPTPSLPTTRIRPTPELLEPADGQIFTAPFITPFIPLKWQWDDELAPDEYFDIQLRPAGQGESVFVDWSRQPYYELSRWAGWKAGRYTWTIAIVRGHLEERRKVIDQYLGLESEQRTFRWDEGTD